MEIQKSREDDGMLISICGPPGRSEPLRQNLLCRGICCDRYITLHAAAVLLSFSAVTLATFCHVILQPRLSGPAGSLGSDPDLDPADQDDITVKDFSSIITLMILLDFCFSHLVKPFSPPRVTIRTLHPRTNCGRRTTTSHSSFARVDLDHHPLLPELTTADLPALQALSTSSSSVDSLTSSETGSPPMKRKVVHKFQGNAKKLLLRWVQSTAAGHHGIEVRDFGPSWRDGVAFQSMVHAIRPDLVDMEEARRRSNRENLEEAFSLAENQLGIPRLLDPEDVDVDKPDEKSIMTYVAQFLKQYPNPGPSGQFGPHNLELMLEREERKLLRELKVFLDQLEKDVLRAQGSDGNLSDKYQVFKSFQVQFEMKKKQAEPLLQPRQPDGKLSADQALVRQAWDHVSARLLDWHTHLDRSLPGPLGAIGAWLHRAEAALREDFPLHHAAEETADVLHRKLQQHQDVLKNLEAHRRTFRQIHRDRSVNGVPVPPEQLQDMAERFNFLSAHSHSHLIQLEFWEMKYRLTAFLLLAESKLKSWIIKYGRRDSVELLLRGYLTFTEGQRFFEQYEVIFAALQQTAWPPPGGLNVVPIGAVHGEQGLLRRPADTTGSRASTRPKRSRRKFPDRGVQWRTDGAGGAQQRDAALR
ncbi:hypothetical protein OJAV_G00217940 [Oryzias javanicus]|uniref:Calponin-homology (CH) domain-containing protein n=1 Tax=Oryzias javanicus TaxID=123683 RepID=A0A3S2M0I9_ORYJA|nr:hypothetical protein OJAV_G00217940 [Oryzias javanicus]